jgi:hypothetical protein
MKEWGKEEINEGNKKIEDYSLKIINVTGNHHLRSGKRKIIAPIIWMF